MGTDIILHVKENNEDENFDEYLEEYKIKALIKKYSDFIRYPIKMDLTERKLKEGSENEYEDVIEEKVVNSMVPIWRKNKNELTTEDYDNFYKEKHYGFDKPLKHIHLSVDGTISYNAILYIPESMPYDFYTKDYEKGLELYSNGVMIMNKCSDLLPDYFGFVKGIVDSEDLSLNISREILQHDRQLRFIAKNIKNKIKNELEKMLKNDRENYEKFYNSFGRTLKFGVYDNFGAEKDVLQDLLMFYSSKEKKMVTLDEYVTRMSEDQKYIYYAVGESIDRIEKLPQTELLLDKGYEILYFTDDIDEFAIKILMQYKEKEFKSVSSSDLGIENNDAELKEEENDAENKVLFESMKEILNGKISAVKISKRLKNHPVCLSNEGDLSIEMEKVLNQMPNSQGIKADKVLEVNANHEVFKVLKDAYEHDKDIKSKMKILVLEPYKRKFNRNVTNINDIIEENLKLLSELEENKNFTSIDEIANPFSLIVAKILELYPETFEGDCQDIRYELYDLGYALGKWIYLIDALDDLKEDMEKKYMTGIDSTSKF